MSDRQTVAMLQKHLAEAEVERLRLVEALERAEQRATDAEHAERVAAHAEADAERRATSLAARVKALEEALRALLRSEHAILGHDVSWCSSVEDFNSASAALAAKKET